MDSLIHSDLILLAARQIELRILGGPSNAGNLFEETLNLKENILAKFSLPACATYLNMLEFEDFPTEFELSIKINELHDLASKYYLKKTKTDIQLLQDAQVLGLDAMDVLPELNISTHIYTRFVYDKVLLKNRDSLKNVLRELNYVNEPEILDALGRLAFCECEEAALASAFLDNFRIKYIQPFIYSLSTVISEDDYWA
ncbi:MAG: hypothetical protein CFE24_14975 [Flavobacterium sp. BFFFF2]|nr:MAG: hypothetical protein CFE24_14975 [Flavobacterium sp. BFFFF2]